MVVLPNWDIMDDFEQFLDTGCSYHPDCLTCPLPQCRYDRYTKPGQQNNESRHQESLDKFRELRAARIGGMTLEQIMLRHQVSKRTIYRALEAKDGTTA